MIAACGPVLIDANQGRLPDRHIADEDVGGEGIAWGRCDQVRSVAEKRYESPVGANRRIRRPLVARRGALEVNADESRRASQKVADKDIRSLISIADVHEVRCFTGKSNKAAIRTDGLVI